MLNKPSAAIDKLAISCELVSPVGELPYQLVPSRALAFALHNPGLSTILTCSTLRYNTSGICLHLSCDKREVLPACCQPSIQGADHRDQQQIAHFKDPDQEALP